MHPEEGEIIKLGDHVEGVVETWGQATKEERRDMLRIVSDAVYVDMTSATVVGVTPKPSFLPLFNLQEPLRAASGLLVTGDPDGVRLR